MYPSIVRAVFQEPWAIRPEVYAVICEVVRFRAEGGRLTDEEIQARVGAARVRAGAARNGTIAVLPLYGVMAQRMNLMTAMSGGTSTEAFTREFQAAIADPTISAVVIDVDSPGGSVFGVQELWSAIMEARGRKPVIAVANSMAASAAYWAISAADEIVVTPSGEVGSIGVLAAHEDISGYEERVGIKHTLIHAGRYKVEGNPYEPLSDEARAALQARVNEYYEQFVASVAQGRGVSAADVRSGFGEGRMVGAREAVRLGMADTVGTLEQTIDRLAGRKPEGPRAETTDGIIADDLNLRVRAMKLSSPLLT